MLLLLPPGWSLNVGGPHLGLPLIKGYLAGRGIPCEIRDLNLETAQSFGVALSEDDLRERIAEYDADLSWDLLFDVAARLSAIAAGFGGEWDVRRGFCFDDCDLTSSQSVRDFSTRPSPFTEFYRSRLLPEIAASSHSVIGLSAILPTQLLSAFEIARLLRGAGYDRQLFLGGNAVTRLGHDLERHWIFDLFDGVVLHQGEPALEALAQHRPFGEVPNLLWRNKGEFVYNGYTRLTPAEFAMPDFTGYPAGHYWGINYLPAISARGCYHGKCRFCAIPYAWGNRGFLGFDDPGMVADYLAATQKRWQVQNFLFVDESMSPDQLSLLADRIIAAGGEYRFSAYARLEEKWLAPSLLETAHRAGLRKVHLGLETVSRERSKLEKADGGESVQAYLQQFHDHGIKAHVFVIVGYPGIRVSDAMETLEFLFDNERLIDTVDITQFLWARHTTHTGIRAVRRSEQDWALTFDYEAEDEGCLDSAAARALTRRLAVTAINSFPRWTDPIYRMAAPWV